MFALSTLRLTKLLIREFYYYYYYYYYYYLFSTISNILFHYLHNAEFCIDRTLNSETEKALNIIISALRCIIIQYNTIFTDVVFREACYYISQLKISSVYSKLVCHLTRSIFNGTICTSKQERTSTVFLQHPIHN